MAILHLKLHGVSMESCKLLEIALFCHFLSTDHFRLPTEPAASGAYFIPSTGVLVLTNARSGQYTCSGINMYGAIEETITIQIDSGQS